MRGFSLSDGLAQQLYTCNVPWLLFAGPGEFADLCKQKRKSQTASCAQSTDAGEKVNVLFQCFFLLINERKRVFRIGLPVFQLLFRKPLESFQSDNDGGMLLPRYILH